MTAIDAVLTEIRTARRYTSDLLEHTDVSDWFRRPTEGVTHIVWQVGHLAIAQHRLALVRIRGPHADDENLVPRSFAELFGKGSQPAPDASAYPPIDEIRSVCDSVHDRVLSENARLSDETLAESAGTPAHPMFDSKLGALRWTAQHEFIHAGQIALIRRLLGYEPRR